MGRLGPFRTIVLTTGVRRSCARFRSLSQFLLGRLVAEPAAPAGGEHGSTPSASETTRRPDRDGRVAWCVAYWVVTGWRRSLWRFCFLCLKRSRQIGLLLRALLW